MEKEEYLQEKSALYDERRAKRNELFKLEQEMILPELVSLAELSNVDLRMDSSSSLTIAETRMGKSRQELKKLHQVESRPTRLFPSCMSGRSDLLQEECSLFG